MIPKDETERCLESFLEADRLLCEELTRFRDFIAEQRRQLPEWLSTLDRIRAENPGPLSPEHQRRLDLARAVLLPLRQKRHL